MKNEEEAGALIPNDPKGELVNVGSDAAQSRELAQVRTAAQMAMMRPRAESQAFIRAGEAAKRPSFAEDAEYRFPRGKKKNDQGEWVENTVSGPSVYVARELARIWGNIYAGVTVVSEDDLYCHVQGFAWDMESNYRQVSEDKFLKRIQRKNWQTKETEWVTPDERDMRELRNKRGAICMRNAILQVLPSDFVEDTLAEARRTLQAASDKKLKADRPKAVTALLESFQALSVTREMLEARLGHKVEESTPEEYAELVRIGKAIKDGQATRDEVFPPPEKVTKGPEPSREVEGLKF